MYKTELCKNFDLGVCPFGIKCRYAHGPVELRRKPKTNNYKTKPCRQFFDTGYCPYGNR